MHVSVCVFVCMYVSVCLCVCLKCYFFKSQFEFC